MALTAEGIRRGSILVAACGLLLFTALSTVRFLSVVRPETFPTAPGPWAEIIAPSPHALNKAALRRLDRGLAALADTEVSGPQRIEAYRTELQHSESLLRRSLAIQPVQAGMWIRLAGMRWEQSRPLDDAEPQALRSAALLAGELAPTYPMVQLRLGWLMLETGRPADALEFLGRAVELDSNSSREAVELLAVHGWSADEMLDGLPRHHRVLVQLQQVFVEEGRREEYWALLDAQVQLIADPTLLERFASNSLLLGKAPLLLRRMDQTGELSDPAVESVRLVQRSRALAAMADFEAAVTDAERARRQMPSSVEPVEHLGDLYRDAGHPEQAIVHYSAALDLLASLRPAPGRSARLLCKIGEQEERRDRPDRAYDAYVHALRADPEQPLAAARIEALRESAGLDKGRNAF